MPTPALAAAGRTPTSAAGAPLKPHTSVQVKPAVACEPHAMADAATHHMSPVRGHGASSRVAAAIEACSWVLKQLQQGKTSAHRLLPATSTSACHPLAPFPSARGSAGSAATGSHTRHAHRAAAMLPHAHTPRPTREQNRRCCHMHTPHVQRESRKDTTSQRCTVAPFLTGTAQH